MQLLRILGVAFGVAVVIGSSIGAGILRTPGAVFAQAGSAPMAIAVWALGGLYAVVGAVCLAELATAIPRSGGFYVYARRALGDGFGFAVGWADWFNNSSATAYGAVTAGEYLALLFPSLSTYVRAVAAIVIVTLALVQLLGMRVSSRVQEVMSFTKAGAFLVLIGAMFVLVPGGPTDTPLQSAQAIALPTTIGFILALQLVIGAYDGWQAGMYFAGEDRNPSRNLPRSLMGGVLVVAAVYLLMNVALLRAMPAEQLAASALPVADAARAVFGERTETAITFLAILSPVSLITALLLAGPRILHAMGSDGLLTRAMAFVDRRGTPSVALVGSTVAALAVLSTGGFESVATIFAFFALTSYAGAFISLFVLRWREPDLPRPFKTWGYPVTPFIVLASAVALLIGLVVGAPRQSLLALLALLASYPVYRLTRRANRGTSRSPSVI